MELRIWLELTEHDTISVVVICTFDDALRVHGTRCPKSAANEEAPLRYMHFCITVSLYRR